MKRGSLDQKLKYVNFIINFQDRPLRKENTLDAKLMYENENLLPYSQTGEFLDPITNTLKKASNYKNPSDMVKDATLFIRLPDKFITNLTMGDFLNNLKKSDAIYIGGINIEVKFENNVVGPTYIKYDSTGMYYIRGVLRNRINNSFVLSKVVLFESSRKNFQFYRNYFETKTLVNPTDSLEFDIKVNFGTLNSGVYGNKEPPCGVYTGNQEIKALKSDEEIFFDASVEHDGKCIILSATDQTICSVSDDTRWKTNPSGKTYADVTCKYYIPDITYLQEKIRLYKELPKPSNFNGDRRNTYAKESIEKLIKEYCSKKGEKDDVVGLESETCYELFPDFDYTKTKTGECKTKDGNYIKYDELETDELKSNCYPGGKPGNSCYDATTSVIPTTITKECYPNCYSNGEKKDFKEDKLGKLCYPYYLYNDIGCEPSEDDKVSGGLKYKYDYDKKCKAYTCISGYINIYGKCKKDKSNMNLLMLSGVVILIIISILII